MLPKFILLLIERRNESSLLALRQQHPEAKEYLETITSFGPGDAATPADAVSATSRELKLRVVQLAAEQGKASADELLVMILRRMRLVARIKLVGAAIAAVSGGVVAVLPLFNVRGESAAMVPGLFCMAGGLTALFADHFERAPSGVKIAGSEERTRLVEMRGNMELIGRRTERDRSIAVPEAELDSMIATLDEYAMTLLKLSYA